MPPDEFRSVSQALLPIALKILVLLKLSGFQHCGQRLWTRTRSKQTDLCSQIKLQVQGQSSDKMHCLPATWRICCAQWWPESLQPVRNTLPRQPSTSRRPVSTGSRHSGSGSPELRGSCLLPTYCDRKTILCLKTRARSPPSPNFAQVDISNDA